MLRQALRHIPHEYATQTPGATPGESRWGGGREYRADGEGKLIQGGNKETAI